MQILESDVMAQHIRSGAEKKNNLSEREDMKMRLQNKQVVWPPG